MFYQFSNKNYSLVEFSSIFLNSLVEFLVLEEL
jgi:hypothetical protein